MELAAFILLLALAYANGTNDVSKAIATLVGSGITNYRAAILWGTFWTMVGAGAAALVAGAMVKTFSQGLVQAGTSIPPIVAMAVLAGAMAWMLCASYTGLPVSTTHVSSSTSIGIGPRKGGTGGELVYRSPYGARLDRHTSRGSIPGLSFILDPLQGLLELAPPSSTLLR